MESMPLAPVTPARLVAAYAGGKRNLARRLVGLIDSIPHTTYAGPFMKTLRGSPSCQTVSSRRLDTLYRLLS